MPLFGRKKKAAPHAPGPSREESLAAVPVRNPEVREEQREGSFLLTYPAVPNLWFGRMAYRLGIWDGSPLIKRLQLDGMGGTVWEWIDGRNSVRDLSEMLAKHYSILPREAEASISAFLRELGRRGIIALRHPPSSLGASLQGRT